jgi:hypothetical protein
MVLIQYTFRMIAIAFNPDHHEDLVQQFGTSTIAYRYGGSFKVFKQAVQAGASKLVGAIKQARRRILEEKGWAEVGEITLWDIIPVIEAL